MTDRHADGQVTTEQRGHVYLMGLDRPEKLNGLTPKMFDELTVAYNELEDNNDLWVGVLFAHGKHFTAGLDLPKFVKAMKEGVSASANEGVDVYALRNKSSKPIVSAVQGITFTAGIEMMLATDIVIAADDCRFSQLEPKRGLMAMGGATVRFVERAGWGNAMYHLLTSDEFDAAEAHRCGFVQEIVPAGQQLDRAIAIAETIAEGAPLAVRATKANSRKYIEEGEAAALAEFPETRKHLSHTDDFTEGVASFKEKRTPKFSGR